MPREALLWLSQRLAEHAIPYQICGGLAAIGYGSKRALNDIDLFVPAEHFSKAVSIGDAFTSKPAGRYQEGEWDVEYVQFIVAATKIEVGNAAKLRVRNASSNVWTDVIIDFANNHQLDIMGVELPVMAPKDLIHYKRLLARDVNKLDIAAVKAYLNAQPRG